MKRLRTLQVVWLIVATVPVALVILNLVGAAPLVTKKEAAIPLALCICLGVGNAMLIEKKIRKAQKPSKADVSSAL